MERREEKKVEHQLFSKFHDYNYRMQKEEKKNIQHTRETRNEYKKSAHL